MSLTPVAASDRDKRIRQLADCMFELHADGAVVTDTLLIGEGFSAFELATLGPAAKSLANDRFVRRIEREGFTRTDDEWVSLAAGAAVGSIGDAQVTTAMLGAGIPPHIIDRLWPKIMRKVGMALGTSPKPVAA